MSGFKPEPAVRGYYDFREFLYRELWDAYLAARRGKRKTVDEHQFEFMVAPNILNLTDDILRRTYRPSRGVAFIIHDPVIREIVAAPFRDRVVHHFLYNVCAAWWDRRFIYDSYSCREGKGTLFGQKRLAHHIATVEQAEGDRAFVAKLDIQGYFMSLDHELLYQRVLWGLKRQFHQDSRPGPLNGLRCRPADRDKLERVVKFLWRQVIFDQPMKNVTVRGQRSDWKDLPSNKSLFCQPRGQGLVIGNLTSQLLSNIFLDQLDRHITQELGYRHYGRYVDDFFIVVPLARKAQLIRDIHAIEEYLYYNLRLRLHPKKRYLQVAEHGVSFVGAVVYPGRILPSPRAQQNFRRAAYFLSAQGEGKIEGITARLGGLKHINSRRFFKREFDRLGWDYDWQER